MMPACVTITALLLTVVLSAVESQSCPQFPDPVPLPTELPSQLKAAIANARQALLQTMQKLGTPGVTAAIVYNQTVIWSEGFGVQNKTSKQPPTPNTPFRIGSISKVFTCMLMMKLRDEGLLSIDDEVVKYLPGFQPVVPFPSTRGPTLKQCATHMSGLPRNTPCSDSACNETNPSIWAKLKQLPLIFPPGSVPHYSNFGFNVLGHALESASGKPFKNTMESEIVQLLGLKNTGIIYTPEIIKKMAVGYNFDGSPISMNFNDIWDISSGIMYSSSIDLCNLISFFFRDNLPKDNKNQILDGQTLREMMEPVFIYPDQQSGLAIPFELESHDNYQKQTKEGDITGYSGKIMFIPKIKLGLAVNCNMEEHAAALADSMANILIDAWDTWLRANQVSNLPPNYQDYIGTYKSTSGALATISLQGTTLLFTSPVLGITTPSPLSPVSYYPNTMRIMQSSAPESCSDVLASGTNALVSFTVARDSVGNRVVRSLASPGLAYGLEFLKA